MIKFDLQLFGGGKKSKSSSTTVKIPNATPEELAELKKQIAYADSTAKNAYRLNDLGTQSLDNALNNVDYNNLYAKYLADNATSQSRNDTVQNSVNNALSTNTKANNSASAQIGSAMNSMQNANQAMDKSYSDVLNTYNSNANALNKGTLSDDYANARRQALNSDLNATVGNALSGLASRGIINSSQADTVLNNIGKNASDTLASQYLNDLNMANSLNTSQLSGNLSGLNARSTLNNTNYANALSGTNAQAGLANQSFSNTLNGASQMGDLLNQSEQLAQNPITTGVQAQGGSMYMPSTYYNLGAGQNANSYNLWNTMYTARNRAASTETTQRNGSNGVWGTVAGIAGAFACFVAGTLVATPHGEVPIEELQEGDTVLGFGIVSAVKKLHTFENKTITQLTTESCNVMTTGTEKVMTPTGMVLVKDLQPLDKIMTVHGFECVLECKEQDKKATVYDIELEGDLFYANGILAEGITESDKKGDK